MVKKVSDTSLWQRIGGLVLGIAVIVYAVYHVVSLFGDDISTVITGISTETTVIDGKGYVFRNENVLYSDYTGVADYLKADGSKVSVGDELAGIGKSGSANARNTVRYLDKKISVLEKSVNANSTLADLPEINENISDAYYSLAKSLASGNTGELSKLTDELLLNMNRHSLLTDESSPVEAALSDMISRREGILLAGGDSITEYASDSGYFYSYVDGYEEYFTVEVADTLTAKSFYALTEKTAANASAVSGAFGKLAENSEWRFVMKMSAVTSGYFKQDTAYTVSFAENGNTAIPMTLTKIVGDDVYGGNLMVFSVNRLPEGFVFDRCQSVSIEVSSASGIYVPKSAVHRMGGQYCVYVLRGSVVTMRRIDVVYETSSYYLSNADAEADGSVGYLKANELLITEGANLFDGRILD